MVKSNSNREIATEITLTATGRTEKLTYIGAGTTCIVYQTESKDIVKEFAPLIRVNNDYVKTMSRKSNVNGELTPLESLSAFHLGLVRERRAAFDSEITIIDELNCRYRNEEDNMFLVPKDMPETSLGRCHWCGYVGGRTLEAVFAESKSPDIAFYHRFSYILPFIISLFDEIAFYHRDRSEDAFKCGILNLDVKPENLFAIKSQGNYIGVRNLDFGSAKRIEDIYDGNALVEQGLITQIRKYALEHNYSIENPSKLLIDKIASKFFASSPGFYDKERIGEIIEKCLNPKKSTVGVISDLKLLDILAAWKTFLFALSDSTDLFLETEKTKYKDEKTVIEEIFAEIFENNQLTQSNSLFESYNIYFQLYEIMARSLGKRKNRLSASDIADRLRNILCILGGVPEHLKSEGQRDFEAMNYIYREKDELLASHGLKTIKDIIEFCRENKTKDIKTPEKLGDLHWFLLFGEKHA